MTDEAPESGEAPHETPGEIEPDRADLKSAVVMGVIFVGTILLSLFLAEILQGQVQPAFEDPQNPTNPLIYLGLVIVFTAVILLIAKLGLQPLIQLVVLGAVFLTMVYLYEPIIGLIPGASGTPALVTSTVLGLALTGLLYFYPEWYVVDVAGISVAAGATGLFGFSFGIVPALVLLVAFAVYDAIAVYRTEHMLDLADQVMELRLPVMLVVPKVADYSFLDEVDTDDEEPEADTGGEEGQPAREDETVEADESEEEAEVSEERDALFMGLGDIVIPGVLVVSSYVFLAEFTAATPAVLGIPAPLFVALTTLVGATAGFAVLMRGVLKGSPHAGLPALNGGALLGFLIPLLALYGYAPLIPQF